MALSANTVVEVRTAGNDTNGGAFTTGATGTDFSQQDLKNTVGSNISTVDAVAVGTGVITSATAAFTAAIVGNVIYLQGGTGALAAGWYHVTIFTNATTITVDRNVAAGTGITMNVGGALVSPGMAAGIGLISGAIIHIKAGTYLITSATPNISGGCIALSLATLIIHGYQTVREDYGTQPLLQASGIATFTIISNTGADCSTANVNVDGAGLVSSRGINQRGYVFKCNALNCTNSGFATSTDVIFNRCTATGCSTAAVFAGGFCVDCVAYDNTVTAFSGTGDAKWVRCIADSNSGATTDGFIFTTGNSSINCVAYNNGRDGFRTSQDSVSFENCIAESNAGVGINVISALDSILFINNATFGNGGGGIVTGAGKGIINMNPVAGASTFFTNAAAQDFSLNNVAGGGAAARNAGYPGVLPVGGTGFLDIGALESGVNSAGGTPYIIGG